MHLRDLLAMSAGNLRRTRNRSALAMLGIVIGVMSVIVILSIGEAAQRFIVGQIASFGSDLALVANGSEQTASSRPSQFIKESLTVSDLKKLERQPWVKLMSGVIMQSDVVSAGGQNNSAQVVGTTPDEPDLYDTQVALGAFFGQADVDSRSNVAVLGYSIAQKSFGLENPIGKSVKIGGEGFRVIGVMRQSGTRFFQNVDQQIYLPYTTAMDLYHTKRFTMFVIKADGSLTEAQTRIEAIVRDQHDITNPDDDDFHVMTQEDVIETSMQITGILQIFLTSIAAISLIVGGIGIMNIMFVSVTERTREIGLRKAVGARRGDVLGQFLTEAIILTGAGGIVGILAGIGMTWIAIQVILQFQSGWSFDLWVNGRILGASVSTLVGVIFGDAPARRAARLNPIEALRYE